jgi:integrase
MKNLPAKPHQSEEPLMKGDLGALDMPHGVPAQYATILKQFNNFMQNEMPLDPANGLTRRVFSEPVVIAFYNHLRNKVVGHGGRKMAPSSINTKMHQLRKLAKLQPVFQNNLAAIALIDRIFRPLCKFKADKRIRKNKSLTMKEFQQFLRACKRHKRPRVALMAEFLAATGLRVSEAINLRLDDLHLYSDMHYSAHIVGKGNKEGWIAVPAELVRRVKTEFDSREYLLETSNHTQYDRSAVYRMLNGMKARTRIRKDINVGPHTFRHTFATINLERLGDRGLKLVQQQLRHSNPGTTIGMYHDTNVLDNAASLAQFNLALNLNTEPEPARTKPQAEVPFTAAEVMGTANPVHCAA